MIQRDLAVGMSERNAAHKLSWRGGDLLQSSRQNGSLHIEGQLDTLFTILTVNTKHDSWMGKP